MERIKIGVVGVGHLGRLHTSMYTQMKDVELVGIYDVDKNRADSVAAEFHTRTFTSLDDMIKQLDAVSVVVPTTHHHTVTKKLIQNGKHCLIEKPISTTLDEADELIELAAAHHVKVQVGHIERFNPALRALEHLQLNPMFIESHRLASFNPRGTDVAVVLDLMIHDIDIILHLVRSRVKSIHANGVSVMTDEVDIANARIEFANGAAANVTASRISQKQMRKMRLFQRNAYISIDFLQKFSEIYQLIDAKSPSDQRFGIPIDMGHINGQKKIIYEKPDVGDENALLLELSSFVETIREDKRPAVSAEDGREALKVAIDITGMIKQQLETLGI